MNEISVKKSPIVMKNGLVHWVSGETHGRIQQALGAQQAHTFMKITELGVTVNTAEIEGVYTTEQYDDMTKIKQGDWQCSFRKWHKKKAECECRGEALRRAREAREEAEEKELNRPLTEEEQEAQRKAIGSVRDDLERKGILLKK